MLEKRKTADLSFGLVVTAKDLSTKDYGFESRANPTVTLRSIVVVR